VRIALVSDTHIPASLPGLPQALLDRLGEADVILHAGDITSPAVIDQLQEIAPTTAVAGNVDPPETTLRYPASTIVTLSGRRIGLQHGHQRHALQNRYIGYPYDAPEFELFYQAMSTQLPDAKVIVFGHFHSPLIKRWRGILFVNPGSIAPPHAKPTFAWLDLGERIEATVIGLSPRIT